jgi:hypothetical protein
LAVGARKITNKGSLKVIGKFPSLKMNTAIWWESQLERDYIYLLEIDPDVLFYQGQPFTITYSSHYALQFVVGKKYRSECTFYPRLATRNRRFLGDKIL